MDLKNIKTFKDWNDVVIPMIGKEIKDISNELNGGFLLHEQLMRALILYKTKNTIVLLGGVIIV